MDFTTGSEVPADDVAAAPRRRARASRRPLSGRDRPVARRPSDRIRQGDSQGPLPAPGRIHQDLFARVASAYADDAEHAQRIYDYISRLWFMPATPVLSNGGTGRGLPISCYLNSVSDSLEGIVGTWNENVWLASRGGGIGTYWGHVRGIGEPVGLNGKTSGIIPFVRVMDSLTLAISQGSLRRGSAACYLDIDHPEIEEFLEIRKPERRLQPQGAQPPPRRAGHRRVHGGGSRRRRVRPEVAQGRERPWARSTPVRCSRSWSRPGSRPASPTSSSSTR
jgi:ribonucleoside-diphosphate reductase alpha chain